MSLLLKLKLREREGKCFGAEKQLYAMQKANTRLASRA